MIPLKVKALFQFIEYLHSNIENFNQQNDLIKEIEKLISDRGNLKPNSNFKEKLKYNELQAEIEVKFPALMDKIYHPVRAKTLDLNLCTFDRLQFHRFNGVESEIHALKDSFSNEDLPEIKQSLENYRQFRTHTHRTFLTLQLFFSDLDRFVEELVDFFNDDTKLNEVENLESKPVQENYSRKELKESFLTGKMLPETSFEIEINELVLETELSVKVKKHFGFFNKNCPRKHKQILDDKDFNKLIDWTILYFRNNFIVPEISEPIKVVNTNKTFVQLAFKYLFKTLHKSSPYPETLFEFYQSAFTPYSEDKRNNFEAVKNNDEVKKLMQIDY
jgi:hypothetical protein